MDANELATAIRFFMACGAILIALLGIYGLLVMWKDIPWSIKMYIVATVFFQLYIADALREAIHVHLPFRNRLFLLAGGETFYFLFFMQTFKTRRLGWFNVGELLRRKD